MLVAAVAIPAAVGVWPLGLGKPSTAVLNVPPATKPLVNAVAEASLKLVPAKSPSPPAPSKASTNDLTALFSAPKLPSSAMEPERSTANPMSACLQTLLDRPGLAVPT